MIKTKKMLYLNNRIGIRVKMMINLMKFCAKIVKKKINKTNKNMIRGSLQNMVKEFYLLKETFKFEISFQGNKILYNIKII